MSRWPAQRSPAARPMSAAKAGDPRRWLAARLRPAAERERHADPAPRSVAPATGTRSREGRIPDHPGSGSAVVHGAAGKPAAKGAVACLGGQGGESAVDRGWGHRSRTSPAVWKAVPMRRWCPCNSSAHPRLRPCKAHCGHRVSRRAGSESTPSAGRPPGVNARLMTRPRLGAGVPDRAFVTNLPPGRCASHQTVVFARLTAIRKHQGCADGMSRCANPFRRGETALRNLRSHRIRIDVHVRIM